ncbi:MAG: deoxyribonuclease IV [Actinobacteria bacterium]|nr:deoxyribonuclease IV [Actinomycetota bacterium]MBU4301544.1 deoxyribonuclease IV [Actinomycetota bacterium]MBU4385595.1 deoxyribonuclease IV [Actinomycetota bacterium]MBU4489559.1 deoxyribonuclease IV [Actinomycetota bacterium]MCG2795877.1 deoxyribonuclease IV [Actinomycetes bacterium]
MRFGYHVKLAGSPVSAIESGVEAGCDTIQMFPGSPQQWGTPKASDEDARVFREARRESGIDPVIIHSIYLVNMASSADQVFKRSASSLASALTKADKLGSAAVVTHIGNHKGEGERFGLERIAAAVNSCLERSPGETMLLLETTAGAGTSIGGRFEQFGEVFDLSGGPDRLGICLDTCHIFAAGYDISTPGGVDAALKELDKYIGLDRLKLLHLNDSKAECGSHTDRHEHIGRGMIGMEAFRYMVNHEALKDLPAIVELAYGGSNPDDIGLLRSLVEG